MKFLVAFCLAFTFTTSFSQVDSLAFVFEEENDYFERMKIAEFLFDRDSTNDELNVILFSYFDLKGKNEKLCICHRNTKERDDKYSWQLLYGNFRCTLFKNNVILAEHLFNTSTDKKDSVIRNRMAYDLSSYYFDKSEYNTALTFIRKHPFNWSLTANWYENRVENRYIVLLVINREYEELATIYDTLLKRSPTNTYYLTQAAQTNTYIKNYTKAIDLYKKVIELDQDENSNTFVRLAQVYSQNNDSVQAKENFEKAIQIDSTDIRSYYVYLNFLNEYGLYEERDSLTTIVLSKPISDFKSAIPSEIYEYYSYISNRKSQLKYIKQAIKIEADSTKLAAYYHRKALLHNQKKAIKTYTTALRYDSTRAVLYISRGNLYLKKFKTKSQEKAKFDFEKALIYSQFSYYPSLANLGLGKYYYYKRSYDEGTEKLNLSIDQNPDNSWAYYYLSRISYSQRDYEKSVELLEKAVQLNPDESLFLISLAVEKEYLLKQKSND